MGLLDNIVGQVAGQALGGGNAQSLVGPLLQALGNGGLQNLIGQLTQGGLGNVVQSWVSTGANLPVSADQLQQALGSSDLAQKLAQQVGLNGADLHGALANVLPGLVDHLTPGGQVPQADAAMPDVGSVLGKIFGG